MIFTRTFAASCFSTFLSFCFAASSFAADSFAQSDCREGFDKYLAEKEPVVEIWAGAKIPLNDDLSTRAANGRKSKNETAVYKKPYYVLDLQESSKPTSLIIVIHGGSYMSDGHKGYECSEVAKFFFDKGYSTMNLAYRAPNNPKGALQDAQRAIRLARANAKAWNIDPNKIAVIGFSAGANLSARVSAPVPAISYEPIDEIDKFSPKPNATILIYPAYCDTPAYEKRWKGKVVVPADYNQKYALAPDLNVDSSTPPAFIYQTQDDLAYRNASIAYYLALKKADVPACLHLLPKGGHGGGLNLKKNPQIPALVRLPLEWLDSLGFEKAQR